MENIEACAVLIRTASILLIRFVQSPFYRIYSNRQICHRVTGFLGFRGDGPRITYTSTPCGVTILCDEVRIFVYIRCMYSSSNELSSAPPAATTQPRA